MARTIENPNKVNWKMYICLCVGFGITLMASICLEQMEFGGKLADIIKNLSYGCIASTVVAWLIDWRETKTANQKANRIYDTVYRELRFYIGEYVSTWAKMCDIAYQDEGYGKEKHTWTEWYDLVKDNFFQQTPERQKHLMRFFVQQLQEATTEVNTAIETLRSQRYVLAMNDIMNEQMNSILLDFRFEFYALSLDLARNDPKWIWEHFDAVRNDLLKYIGNWPDIHFYNNLMFRPFGFWSDEVGIQAAIRADISDQNEAKVRKAEMPLQGKNVAPTGDKCEKMLAYTYIEKGVFKLIEKPKPELQNDRDAIVRVTMSSICTSDLHIKHGSVPRAVPGITVGHEMVGIVEQVGSAVTKVKPGDRVTVNVETFCGECFFCQNGWVNNCTDENGGWALGCRVDGGQTEFVRVPYADQGLNQIPDNVSDLQALLVGDVLATGFWAAKISEIKNEDTVLIIGAGPTGICTLQCVQLYEPKNIIVCDIEESRLAFVKQHYPEVTTCMPSDVETVVKSTADHGGADVVLEVAGSEDTFRMAWQLARPNAIVTVVALYDGPQTLPLPDMYGKNLTFKTGGVDGCNCDETLALIAEGKLDTTPLITHTFPLSQIEEAYELFEKRKDGVIKVAIHPDEQ